MSSISSQSYKSLILC